MISSADAGADVLMPAQFFEIYQRRDTRMDGVRKLLFAELDDAVQCFLGNGMMVSKSRDDSRTSLRQAAEVWVADESDSTPFGFTFVQTCSELSINASAFRRGLVSWRTNHDADRQKPMPKARQMAGTSRMTMQQNYTRNRTNRNKTA
jgi:hypothetical protein